MTTSKALVLIAALTAGCLLGQAANSESFTTFGASPPGYGTSANAIRDPAVSPGTPSLWKSQAARFIPTVGGPLELVEFAQSRGGGTTPRKVYVRANAVVNNVDLPGAIIESWLYTPVIGGGTSVKQLYSVAKPTLTVGVKYWLTIEMSADGNANDFWFLSNPPIGTIPLAYQAVPDGPWIATTGGVGAFRITVSDIAYGSISGTVKADTNGDDVGDTALANVTVTLKDSAGNDIDGDPGTAGVQPKTALTSGTGAYTLPPVAPGTYQVVETNPAGYASVADSDGGDPDRISPIVVAAGAAVVGKDFVDAVYAAISGMVVADTGVGTTPLASVTVTLHADTDRNGVPDAGPAVATASTGPDGTYRFESLLRDDYVVVEQDPSGYLSLNDSDAVADAAGSPADLPNLNVVDNRIPVSLAAGETDSGNNFVDQQFGVITGTVIADFTGDNQADGLLPDVYVTLKTGAGTFVATTHTDYIGRFLFNSLPVGTYMIQETQPFGFTSIKDSDLGNPDLIESITVAPGQTNSGHYFLESFVKPPTGVTLDYFRAAETGGGQVELVWRTLVEAHIIGYHVERATASGDWERLTRALIPAGWGEPTAEPYRLLDAHALAQGGKYRLVEVNANGQERVLAEALAQPAPTIRVSVAEGNLRIEVTGQPHRTLVVESAHDLSGAWTPAQSIELDAAGTGAATLALDPAQPIRFLRAVEN